MSGPSSTTPLKKAEFLVRVWRAIMPPMEWPYRNIGIPAPCPAPAPPAFTRAQCRITSWTRGHVILVILDTCYTRQPRYLDILLHTVHQHAPALAAAVALRNT